MKRQKINLWNINLVWDLGMGLQIKSKPVVYACIFASLILWNHIFRETAEKRLGLRQWIFFNWLGVGIEPTFLGLERPRWYHYNQPRSIHSATPAYRGTGDLQRFIQTSWFWAQAPEISFDVRGNGATHSSGVCIHRDWTLLCFHLLAALSIGIEYEVSVKYYTFFFSSFDQNVTL